MMPKTIYYDLVSSFKNEFSDVFGKVIEQYVGLQLREIQDAKLLPEIEYVESGDRKLSIDWFLITDQAVFLIESKSARFSVSGQAGEDSFAQTILDKVDDGIRQINDTHRQLMNNLIEFSDIPKELPLIGIIVTSDSLYLANSSLARSMLRESHVPTLTLSLRELENMVPLGASKFSEELIRVAKDPELRTWPVSTSTRFATRPLRNQILDEAADRLYVFQHFIHETSNSDLA